MGNCIKICPSCGRATVTTLTICSVCSVPLRETQYSEIYWGKCTEARRKQIIAEVCPNASGNGDILPDVVQNMDLRERIIQELKSVVARDEAAIKKCDSSINGAKITRTKAGGGVLGAAVRESCDRNERNASIEKEKLKVLLKWKTEMLAKYSG